MYPTANAYGLVGGFGCGRGGFGSVEGIVVLRLGFGLPTRCGLWVVAV